MYSSRLTNAATQSSREFLTELGKLPLHYQPGTTWEYSYGLDVAALVVEAVTRQRRASPGRCRSIPIPAGPPRFGCR